MKVIDEMCSDKAYCNEIKKTKCTVEIFANNFVANQEVFRQNVENYFKARPESIEEIIECEIGDWSVILKVSVLNMKRGWDFFCDRKKYYGDLKGVDKVLHKCKNTGNCDND